MVKETAGESGGCGVGDWYFFMLLLDPRGFLFLCRMAGYMWAEAGWMMLQGGMAAGYVGYFVQ